MLGIQTTLSRQLWDRQHTWGMVGLGKRQWLFQERPAWAKPFPISPNPGSELSVAMLRAQVPCLLCPVVNICENWFCFFLLPSLLATCLDLALPSFAENNLF